MSLMRKSDPFCLGDCITYQELLTSFSYNGAPQNIMIYLASKALVSLVNDAQWDVDRIRPSVFSFIDTDAVLYEDHGPGSVVRFTDLSLDFWDFQVSPTLVVYIDMILNSAPIYSEERAPDDNDKMVIVEPVDDKYHVLVARMGAMISCDLEDPIERAEWWGDEIPIVFEVDDFDDFVTVLKQLRRGKKPDFRTLWFDKQKQKPAPVCLATTTPEAAPSAALATTTSDHIPAAAKTYPVAPHLRAKQQTQAAPSAILATTTSDHTPVAAKTYPVPPHESSKQHSRCRSPALSEVSSSSSDEVVFHGRGNTSADEKTFL